MEGIRDQRKEIDAYADRVARRKAEDFDVTTTAPDRTDAEWDEIKAVRHTAGGFVSLGHFNMTSDAIFQIVERHEEKKSKKEAEGTLADAALRRAGPGMDSGT